MKNLFSYILGGIMLLALLFATVVCTLVPIMSVTNNLTADINTFVEVFMAFGFWVYFILCSNNGFRVTKNLNRLTNLGIVAITIVCTLFIISILGFIYNL
jgi:hypothetical protein